jgi:hypothetical protein
VSKGGFNDPPPANTPHTIALDMNMRAAAAAGEAGGSGREEGAAAAGEFLMALALCNTVVPTATEEGQLLYQVGGWCVCVRQ